MPMLPPVANALKRSETGAEETSEQDAVKLVGRKCGGGGILSTFSFIFNLISKEN